MVTVVDLLEKADIKAKEYVRGPAGPKPFILGITPAKPSGLVRVWEGQDNEIEVHRSKRDRQAVINVVEGDHEIPERNMQFNIWVPTGTDEKGEYFHGKDPNMGVVKNRAKADFNSLVVLGSGKVTYEYGEVKHTISGEERRWNGTITGRFHNYNVPVSAKIRSDGQVQSMLTGMDETHHFVCALPEVASSVKDAHEILRPKTANKPGTIRQGEWFFIPVKNEKLQKDLMNIFTKRVSRTEFRWGSHSITLLPALENGSTHRALTVNKDGKRYTIGMVIDTRPGRHQPLFLTTFHEIVRNREIIQVPARSSNPTRTRRRPGSRYWD